MEVHILSGEINCNVSCFFFFLFFFLAVPSFDCYYIGKSFGLVWFHYINKSKRRINGSRFLSIGNSPVACISSLFFIVHSSVVLSVHSFIHSFQF